MEDVAEFKCIAAAALYKHRRPVGESSKGKADCKTIKKAKKRSGSRGIKKGTGNIIPLSYASDMDEECSTAIMNMNCEKQATAEVHVC